MCQPTKDIQATKWLTKQLKLDSSNQSPSSQKIPKHHLYDLINKAVATITDHRWNSETHSHWLQLLFPTSKALRHFLSVSKGLLQVRKLASGYYPLRNYLFQRSLAPSPHCLHCQASQTESIFHRVFICETFQRQRTILFLTLDFFPRNTIEILLSKDKKNLQALDIFLTACKQRRWKHFLILHTSDFPIDGFLPPVETISQLFGD